MGMVAMTTATRRIWTKCRDVKSQIKTQKRRNERCAKIDLGFRFEIFCSFCMWFDWTHTHSMWSRINGANKSIDYFFIFETNHEQSIDISIFVLYLFIYLVCCSFSICVVCFLEKSHDIWNVWSLVFSLLFYIFFLNFWNFDLANRFYDRVIDRPEHCNCKTH